MRTYTGHIHEADGAVVRRVGPIDVHDVWQHDYVVQRLQAARCHLLRHLLRALCVTIRRTPIIYACMRLHAALQFIHHTHCNHCVCLCSPSG